MVGAMQRSEQPVELRLCEPVPDRKRVQYDVYGSAGSSGEPGDDRGLGCVHVQSKFVCGYGHSSGHSCWIDGAYDQPGSASSDADAGGFFELSERGGDQRCERLRSGLEGVPRRLRILHGGSRDSASSVAAERHCNSRSDCNERFRLA